MKFNWGMGIVVAMVAFMAFIVYFLIKATADTNYNHEFVTENYYEKELEYEKKSRLENITKQKGMQVAINYEKNKGVWLVFPPKEKIGNITGVVSFYRPNNQKLDFEQPIQVDENHRMHISPERLVDGRWDISVEYNSVDNQKYITTFKISY